MTKREYRPASNGTFPFSLEARDEDYDTYLFWPSLNSKQEHFKKPLVATHHRVNCLNHYVPQTHCCLL
jgi:hypothetical protein